jgi:hypothetical protein
MSRRLIMTIAPLVWLVAVPAAAHHEAIFGPASPLVFSGTRYFTAQVFTRRTGPPGERVQETTTVLSGGFSPTRVPMSISVVMPFSVIAPGASGGRQVGLENTIVMARYSVPLPAVARAFGVEDSYVLGGGGVELPTGTIDHDFGEGPPAVVAGALFSIERRPFSVIGYGFMQRYTERRQIRDSGHTFLGAGVAWTPIDASTHGRIFSLQFGLSRESASREVLAGIQQDASGGWALVAHPSVVWGPGDDVLFFAMTSVALADDWRDPADQERFRVGVGTILTFGR